MKQKYNFNTLVMIFAVVILVAILTWIIPGGEYQREIKDGKTLVIADSFQFIDNEPQGIGEILLAPIKGFQDAAYIIIFLFVIGGAFMVVSATGAINVSVQKLADTFSNKPHLQKFLIPISMTIFSIGGSTFGMCEETLPFVLIFIPLALSLGYDSIVGTAIPFLGAAAGFAGSTLNPFIIGIAQGISEIPLYSGLEFRIIVWAISTGGMIAFVMWYAARIKKDPTKSPMYEIDKQTRHTFHLDNLEKAPFTINYKIILILFVLAIGVLIFGILEYSWYINEIAGLFFALGILCGIVGKLSFSQIADNFKEGAKDMVGIALIISCARAILIIMQNGKILDVMLYGVSNVISDMHPVFASQTMFISQGVINFFVHSGSGQAMLTMPIMAPLADLVGLTRQTAVLAFQFGEGWITPILPTSGVTMGVLGLAKIPWNKWFRWMLPIQIIFFIIALILLAIAVFINYQ
ncbi:MAG: putative basic amino acid antiporter YfcC [Ignavibacteriales bacterium]|nr:putative basic amino acid antiporter YfcC [Ignavibacteriales bacterium]